MDPSGAFGSVVFGFLSPRTLLAILAGAAAVLTLLYLLRERRRRLVVPFAPLWHTARGPLQSSALMRHLRRLWSLLLALLLVALLAVGASDPRPEAETGGARSIVILVDASASMAATDLAPSRLEAAVEQVRRYVDGLRPQDAAMIVRMDGRPAPLSPLTHDTATLKAALSTLVPGHTRADVAAALALATHALRERPGPTLVIASDFAFGDRDSLALSTPALSTGAAGVGVEPRVELIRVGVSGANVAITAFSVRRYLADWTAFEVFGALQSFHDAPVRVRIRLYLDDAQIAERVLTVPPGEPVPLVEEALTLGDVSHAGRLTARLEPLDGITDFLAVDDVAYAVLPPRKRLEVALVGEENRFLEGALVVGESVAYERFPCAGLDPAPLDRFDVVVLDGCPISPERFGADARLFYLDVGAAAGADPAAWPWRTGPSRTFPELRLAPGSHPVLRWVSLADVAVEEARPLEAGPDDRPLLLADGKAIALARTLRAGESLGRWVGLGFDVRRTDFPLRVAFPVFVLNVLDWLTEQPGEGFRTALRTGEAWHLPLLGLPAAASTAAAGDSAEVILPSGRSIVVPVHDGAAVVWGSEQGIHRLRTSTGEILFAANLVDPQESAVRPPDLVPLDGVPAQLGPAGGISRWWFWLLVGALCITLLEWWSFHRRLTV